MCSIEIFFFTLLFVQYKRGDHTYNLGIVPFVVTPLKRRFVELRGEIGEKQLLKNDGSLMKRSCHERDYTLKPMHTKIYWGGRGQIKNSAILLLLPTNDS